MEYLGTEDSRLASDKVRTEVPLTKSQYDYLRGQLSSSKAEEPILRVRGNLEITIDKVCLN
tara:strand:+ start:450 stop:632 length:183 start_codon:yes stop_codon:yes gene_type:complete